jgi:predicted HicB family RNase H-like nuclease
MIANTLTYKGYTAHCTVDVEAGVIVGVVQGLKKDTLIFEVESVPEVKTSLKSVVDTYIAACEEDGVQPERP